MTRRKAVLHIGTMKTGTSTLQQSLAQNSEHLASLNYAYLGWPMRRRVQIERELDRIDESRNILISDEGLWHLCGTARSSTSQIAIALRDFDITIVVYFRRPDQYVEAWFSQGLKSGTGALDLATFLTSPQVNSLGTSPGAADLRALLDLPSYSLEVDFSILKNLRFFESVFPEARLIVRPFEKVQLSQGDIVADFVDTVGFDLATPLQPVPNENVSPSADTILLVGILREQYQIPQTILSQLLNPRPSTSLRSLRGIGQRRSLTQILREHYGVNDRILGLLPGSKPAPKTRILSVREATAINAGMRDAFREVQTNWGGGSTDEFFVDWELDPRGPQQSKARDMYDELVPAWER